MTLKLALFGVLLLSTTLIAYCLMKGDNHIPLKILLGNPEKASPQISPDGTKLAYLKPNKNNVLNVWVRDIDKANDIMVTDDNLKGIRSYFWQQDSQHILYIQDKEGDERNHIYQTDVVTKTTVNLTPYDGVRTRLLAHNKFHPNYLVFIMNKRSNVINDVYKIDLTTHETTMIQEGFIAAHDWLLSADLEIKGVHELDENGSLIFKLKQDDGSWKTLFTWDYEDIFNCDVSHLSVDGKTLYFSDSFGKNTAGLYAYDIVTQEKTLIAEHPTAEINSALYDSNTRAPLAVEFYTSRNEWKLLDDSLQEDFTAIESLHHGDFSIVNKTSDQQKWIVSFTQDVGPVVWFMYDRTTKTGTKLFYARPELLKYKLQPMHPISFTARDGLELHGYITYPENYQNKKSPLIVNVHGGPWARDTWRYHYEAQWMANRGYACLQVNYRGSTGYGKKLLAAGTREWGKKAHTDLVDAANWAKSTGYIDENRVAIYGGSYGGYSALCGATFTPDDFTCAVAIVGFSNLFTMIKSFPPYVSNQLTIWYQRVGHPEKDKELLTSISPYFHADKIKCPVLVVQGGNDPRCPQEEAEQIVSAMKENNVEHEYLLFPDEGHGFAKPHNRLKFYQTAEKFLEKYMQ